VAFCFSLSLSLSLVFLWFLKTGVYRGFGVSRGKFEKIFDRDGFISPLPRLNDAEGETLPEIVLLVFCFLVRRDL
jgi:hypothetical protein